MRVSWNEITSRLTGAFGVSWTPEPNECKVAEELVTYLENQGLLYSGLHWEHPKDCFESANRVRSEVNTRMQQLRRDMNAFKSMDSIQSALGAFRNALRDGGLHQFDSKSTMTNDEIARFDAVLIKLRQSAGVQIARLAVACKFDVSDRLDPWLR